MLFSNIELPEVGQVITALGGGATAAVPLAMIVLYLVKYAAPKLLETYREDVKRLTEMASTERREMWTQLSSELAKRDAVLKDFADKQTDALDRLSERVGGLENAMEGRALASR